MTQVVGADRKSPKLTNVTLRKQLNSLGLSVFSK